MKPCRAGCAVLLATLWLCGPGYAKSLSYKTAKSTTLVEVAAIVYGSKRYAAPLATANKLKLKDRLKKGQTLRIPVSYRVVLSRPTSTTGLAKKHLKRRDRALVLAAVNKIKLEAKLTANQKIVVPALLWHVASKGDSMRTLSRRYYQNLDGRWLLRRVNGGRTNNATKEGERIMVPLFAAWSDRQQVSKRIKAAQPAEEPIAEQPAQASSGETEETTQAPAPIEETPEPNAANTSSFEAAQENPLIRDGVALFRRGDFLAAVSYFRRALLEPNLDLSLRVAAYVWLASCYVAVDEPERAEEAMRAALRSDPTLRLSPVNTSPKIMRVLEDARARMEVGG